MLVLAIGCGYAVNPDNIVAQLQGSTVFALTAVLWGEITIKDGHAVKTDPMQAWARHQRGQAEEMLSRASADR